MAKIRDFYHPYASNDFFDISDRVHPEASDSLVQPEVCHVVKSLPHLGVLPVEVRLLAEECVKIILTACL